MSSVGKDHGRRTRQWQRRGKSSATVHEAAVAEGMLFCMGLGVSRLILGATP